MSEPTEPAPQSAAPNPIRAGAAAVAPSLPHVFGGGALAGLWLVLDRLLDKFDALSGALDLPKKMPEFVQALPTPLWVVLLLVFLAGTGWYAGFLADWFRQRRGARGIKERGAEPAPGYFHIGPYQTKDRAEFTRADGAETEILNWLTKAVAVPLYLTGDSGCGKSSLLYAYLVPELEARGWDCYPARAYRDPEAALREELARRRAKRPEDSRTLRDLAESLARRKPLLLILDQFEEFLIREHLEDSAREARRRFAALVADLRERPVPNLRLLLVLRYDYQPLLTQGEAPLPPPDYSATARQLAAFHMPAARKFMSESPLKLEPSVLERLLKSAARLDKSEGMVRPITLNVLGKIVTESDVEPGATGAGLDAGRLVQGYLARTLQQKGIRDHAGPVVEMLVSALATKLPRTVAELAAGTGLPEDKVQLVLNALAQAGLARWLEEHKEHEQHGSAVYWELSHDFVADAFSTYLRLRRADVGRLAFRYGVPAVLIAVLAGVGVYAATVVLPAHAEREPILPELVDIPAGSFCMGSQGEAPSPPGDFQSFIRREKEKSHSPEGEAPSICPELPEDPEAQPNEMPARRVQVPAFRLGRHEVTAGEFRRFVKAMQARGKEINWTDDARTVDALPPAERTQKDRLPAVNLSYDDAVAYAEWLSRETGQRYRLPTEAEWEYAARAGTLTRRWWGDDPQHEEACAHANVLDRKALAVLKAGGLPITWEGFACETDGYVWSAPVGHFGTQGANRFGLQDMLGNVWEWVADCYHDSYQGAPAGPEAWVDGTECASGRRVVRGGAWLNVPMFLRSAYRFGNTPVHRNFDLGFRLAQDQK